MYKPDHFKIQEVVPKLFFHKYHAKYGIRLFGVFDDRALWTGDRLRELYGKVLMNTWLWGGEHQYRGFRPRDCTIGAELSQHRFGRAEDLFFISTSAEKVRQDILANPDQHESQYITAIELNTFWLHFDCRNWDKKKHGILTFKP